MAHHRFRPLIQSIAGLALLTFFGCQQDSSTKEAPAQPLESSDELRITTQQLGEASTPLYTPGTGLEPDYRARVLGFMYNRIRIAPHLYGLTINDENGTPIAPYIPVPPARLDSFMTEPGRWAAQFNEETGCDCSPAAVGYDPMMMMPREAEPLVAAVCCELDVVGGVAECVSPVVPCDHERATLRDRRWAKLNQGASRITNEGITRANDPITAEALSLLNASLSFSDILGQVQFLTAGLRPNDVSAPGSAIGASIMSSIQVPEECLPQPEQCIGGGTCIDNDTGSTVCDKEVNAQCLGLCDGGTQAGDPCTLPDQASGMPEDCNPEDFPVVETVVLATGQTQAPVPVLTDGIHAQLGINLNDFNLKTPDGSIFYPTPEGQTTFAVHYYETNGTPVGTPQSIQVVLDDTCHDLTVYDTPDTLLVSNAPAPYSGDLFAYNQLMTEGCHPYVFVAKDGVGFEYTYPTYGALQAKIDGDGKVVLNDDTCPIWTNTRPNLSCVPAPQECEDGDTRPCYTGLYGTQDFGACAPGQETCSNGRWSGECTDQILPEAIEICHDGIDNDCNGGVDEGCFCNWKDSVYGVCFNAPRNTDRECVAPETYEDDETLCDGLDNDCDGLVDEGCPCDYTGVAAGVCEGATRDEAGECVEPETYEEIETLCDDLDNDCDGVADEGCTCNYLDITEGVCAAQIRTNEGECGKPDTHEDDETLCDGLDNDCDGDIDEGCASSCDSSIDCRWEDGHACEGRTTAGEKFCVTQEGDYREARTADPTTNPECTDDADCNGVCEPYGLTCVDTNGSPSTPKTKSGDDTCGSPLDCPLNYTCESRDGIRQCISPDGEPEDLPGCGGCSSSNGSTPDNLPLLALFGLLMLRRRRRAKN